MVSVKRNPSFIKIAPLPVGSARREALREYLSAHPRGFVRRVAEAAGCGTPYISKILNGHAGITPGVHAAIQQEESRA